MKTPKSIEKVISHFESLPGIGPKSAQRLAFYLLHVPQEYLENFSDSLRTLKENTFICETCFNIGDTQLCEICRSDNRDRSVVCVVEDPLDVVAITRSGKFDGLFHVLHGVIDPLNSMGPDDIYIPQLMKRVTNNESEIAELILATNPTMEGEATAMYIAREVEKMGNGVRVTRIGRGLPTGADIEFADEITLERALESRREY